MSCYHPLKAWPVGKNPSGKTKYLITGYEVHHLEQRQPNGPFIPVASDYLSPYRVASVLAPVTIPCGKCIGCRLDYSRQWANRCMLELGYHDSAYFLTLTYDESHVPRRWYADKETGEAYRSLTLDKRDWQLFMKRLRKRFPDDKIRFFMCGEYGSSTFRPHYHAIVFGLHLNDLVEKFRHDGFVYYTSQSLQDCWSVREGSTTPLTPIGFAIVSEVSWDTCAYVARYVTKKLTGPEGEFYSDHNIIPPFTLMSRKPGIARQYYDDHPDLYESEFINISTPQGGKKFRPPKYFDRLFEDQYPEESAKMKELRKHLAEEAQKAKLASTDLDLLQYLEVEEQKKLNSLKKLERNEI